MEKLTPGLLKRFQGLAAQAKKENLQMVLITPGPHSEHYGSIVDLDEYGITFRTDSGDVVAGWAPGTYIKLTQTQIVPVGNAAKARGA